MTTEILELVKNNNRVILPNFGAFIISKENGFSVLFNNFLSFNDGLLVNYIASSRSIDSTKALTEVTQFIDSLKKTLDDTGIYEFDGLGKFTKDSNGILRFIQSGESIVTEKAEKPESGLLDIVPAAEATNVPIINESAEEAKTTFASTDNLLNIDNEPEKEKAAPTPPPAQPKPTPKAAAPRIEKKPEVKVTTTHKKRSPLVFILLAIFLLIGGAVYYFGWVNPIDLKKFTLFGKKNNDTTTVAPPPPAPIEKVELPTPPPVPATAAVASDIKYHIIVATTRNEQQANDQVNKLKEKGFANAMVLPHNEKFLVSIDAANDLVGADARQEEIVNQYRIESYVLTLK